MAHFKGFPLLAIALLSSILLALSVKGQMISTPCTLSMITSFTPCINFITGSSNNGSSPTQSCCRVLGSVLGTSVDCACLLVTANVPVQLPINRTLALSLPQACNLSGVPVQCKASGSPLPSAPGPSFGLAPSQSPIGDHSPLSPRASKAVARAPAPDSETNGEQLAPEYPPVEAPTGRKIRPVLIPPSSSSPDLVVSSISSYHYLLVLFTGIFMAFKLH